MVFLLERAIYLIKYGYLGTYVHAKSCLTIYINKKIFSSLSKVSHFKTCMLNSKNPQDDFMGKAYVSSNI